MIVVGRLRLARVTVVESSGPVPALGGLGRMAVLVFQGLGPVGVSVLQGDVECCDSCQPGGSQHAHQTEHCGRQPPARIHSGIVTCPRLPVNPEEPMSQGNKGFMKGYRRLRRDRHPFSLDRQGGFHAS